MYVMINVMSNMDASKIPLGIYRVYWVTGGSSACVIAQDSRGVRYIHCTNWTVVPDGPMTRLDRFEKDIIRMENLQR